MSIAYRQTMEAFYADVKNEGTPEPLPVTALDCQKAGDDRTVQTHKKACDINHIVARNAKDGILSHAAKYAPQYGAVTAYDYEEMLNAVADVKTMYAELPAEVRREFGNESAFLSFMQTRTPEEIVEKLPILARPGTQLPDVIGGGAAVEPAEPASTPEPAEPAEDSSP